MKWLGTIDYTTLDSDNTAFLGFNNSTFPFNNKKLRKAILKAINTKKIISIKRGNSIIAKGPLPPILHSYQTNQQETYDIEFAKKTKTPLPNTYYIRRVQENFRWLPFAGMTRTIKCGKCGANTETSWPKECDGRILCEGCYLREVV